MLWKKSSKVWSSKASTNTPVIVFSHIIKSQVTHHHSQHQNVEIRKCNFRMDFLIQGKRFSLGSKFVPHVFSFVAKIPIQKQFANIKWRHTLDIPADIWVMCINPIDLNETSRTQSQLSRKQDTPRDPSNLPQSRCWKCFGIRSVATRSANSKFTSQIQPTGSFFSASHAFICFMFRSSHYYFRGMTTGRAKCLHQKLELAMTNMTALFKIPLITNLDQVCGPLESDLTQFTGRNNVGSGRC